MNNKPIIPNIRKAQKRDSKNIDADKIQNLTLGELQEELINSTLRVKGKDSFSPNYGLSKASSYSLFKINNPNTPKEVVDEKDNINNWLEEQNVLNNEEPYNYLTFGAFKQWARSIVNLLGKSGDSLQIGLYFCDSNGERIDSIKKGPLYKNDKYYFKFYQKNFDEISTSEGRKTFLLPTIDGLKGRNYTINTENSQEHLYSISINVLQYQPESSSIELKLTYLEAGYEVYTSLTIEIPEWSMLLVTNPANGSSTLEDTYFSTDDTSLINLSNNEGSVNYHFILLHNCYYFNYIIDKGNWLIKEQRLAGGRVDYKTDVSIQDELNSSILNGRESFIVYTLTVDYSNPYNNLQSDSLVQILNIQVENLFEFNIAFSIKDRDNSLSLNSIVGAKYWQKTGGNFDFKIGSGSSEIVVGKQETVEIQAAINQPLSFILELNYVQSDTLEDQYVNCYGSSNQNTDYLKIGLDQPTSSFVSSNIEETDVGAIYKFEDSIKVVKLNTSSSSQNATVPIYFAHLTADEDKEFRETSETLDLEQWLITRKQKTEFPIFKLILRIRKTDWCAYLNYPITNTTNIQPIELSEDAYIFQLIPLENINSNGEYSSEFKLITTNISAAEGSIYQGTAELPTISVENDGPFQSIEIKPQYRYVENGQNTYSFKAISKINPESFFQNDYKDYKKVTFTFEHDAGESNKVIIKFIPKDIVIFKTSDSTYKYIEIGNKKEIVSFIDPLTKTKQESEENFTNFSDGYNKNYQFQPVGSDDWKNDSTDDKLKLPNFINSGAWDGTDHSYFYGLIELGIHINTNSSPSFYISSRFDDWVPGIYINRPIGTSPTPNFSYTPSSLFSGVSVNSTILSWLESLRTGNENCGRLVTAGPFYKSVLKNGKNTIEFLVYNNKGGSLFQCALTIGEAITKDNYGTWGYRIDLTK